MPAHTLPRVLEVALAAPGGRCYRHCERPVRTRRLRSPLPGTWQVRACPAGVVSVVVYTEWVRRDLSQDVLHLLRGHTVPRSLVHARDLRLATRHGPELGTAAERFLARARPRRGIRVVYWRVYPFQGKDGAERRLFVCLRTRHPTPVFFAAPSSATAGDCPSCAAVRRSTPRRARKRR